MHKMQSFPIQNILSAWKKVKEKYSNVAFTKFGAKYHDGVSIYGSRYLTCYCVKWHRFQFVRLRNVHNFSQIAFSPSINSLLLFCSNFFSLAQTKVQFHWLSLFHLSWKVIVQRQWAYGKQYWNNLNSLSVIQGKHLNSFLYERFTWLVTIIMLFNLANYPPFQIKIYKNRFNFKDCVSPCSWHGVTFRRINIHRLVNS